MTHDYLDYFEDIGNSIQEIDDFTTNISFAEFIKDKKTVNAVIRSLEVIGEAAKRIPDEIRAKYPDIPWKRMTGMRDKLIHEYSGVDLEIVWTVAKEELPQLNPMIKEIISSLKK
jgi:uncharacterized protein with HEPN domain